MFNQKKPYQNIIIPPLKYKYIITILHYIIIIKHKKQHYLIKTV